eukprot:Pompholyxophrys_sp_v1_NODE_360_length_682_cov_22.598086.p1 type:complete len:122 gc:universal NODE_360_length_682_cov_22.598086:13-378(+)
MCLLNNVQIGIGHVTWTSCEYKRSQKHVNYVVLFQCNGVLQHGFIKTIYIINERFYAVVCPLRKCAWEFQRTYFDNIVVKVHHSPCFKHSRGPIENFLSRFYSHLWSYQCKHEYSWSQAPV